MVAQVPTLSLSAKREALARIHGRYQRAGRPHQTRILDDLCPRGGYHRQAALRLLNRPLPTAPPKRSGPKIIYEPAEVLPALKAVWLASDQLCGKLLKAALPAWLEHYERRSAPLPEAFKEKLLRVSPAQIDRLLRPARVQHPKNGLSATRPGTLLRHAVPTRSGPPPGCSRRTPMSSSSPRRAPTASRPGTGTPGRARSSRRAPPQASPASPYAALPPTTGSGSSPAPAPRKPATAA